MCRKQIRIVKRPPRAPHVQEIDAQSICGTRDDLMAAVTATIDSITALLA